MSMLVERSYVAPNAVEHYRLGKIDRHQHFPLFSLLDLDKIYHLSLCDRLNLKYYYL
jgi:hypothetical protein